SCEAVITMLSLIVYFLYPIERNREYFHRICLPGLGGLVRDGMICIFPCDHRIDGMFAAAWRRDQ
ncbi:MAG: hypothetical protein K8S24_08330, partial [Candidatus Aegiribacteria sp.]|nr:hypothetical protein [Candidatus Aegiribacteria sp.]